MKAPRNKNNIKTKPTLQAWPRTVPIGTVPNGTLLSTHKTHRQKLPGQRPGIDWRGKGGQRDEMEIGAFIDKWRGVTGGQERANYGQFINDFCQALTLPLPQPAAAGVLGDYQFEGPVQGGGAGGNTGAIDLYKKGHFILEAKQSKLSDAQKAQSELFDAAEDAPVSPSGARYDRLMRDALAQAKRYAVNLPSNHPWPPFLIVCDVGRAFELYFDYSGNGRGYGYFPDQHS